MFEIRCYMTGMLEGEVEICTLPFATEGEFEAFNAGVNSLRDPAGTEYQFKTEIEGKWFDHGRSTAMACAEGGHGIRIERVVK